MSFWDVFVSIFWFMLLVAWFWLLMSIVADIFRDHEMSGWGKAAWCLFVILLPWIGVLTYLIARGRSMNERAMQAHADNERAFRQYVRDAAASPSGVADELGRLADLHDQGKLSATDYEAAKSRVLGTAPAPSNTAPSNTAPSNTASPTDVTA